MEDNLNRFFQLGVFTPVVADNMPLWDDPIMPKTLLVTLSALAWLSILPAQTVNIPIQNPSFETATLPLNIGAGPFSNLIAGSTLYATGGTLANWTASSTTVDAAAGAITSTAGWLPSWWAGNNIGFIQIGNAGTASLSQTLSTTLQNNVTYTLSALVARPVNALGFNYALQLWAGPTVLASASNLLGLAQNTSGLGLLCQRSR